MSKPIITAEDMAITYNIGKSNEFKALQGVDAEIYPKEYIILFGPSGCGKSTLLYSILGGLPPATGRMIVKGEDIYQYKPSEMVTYQRSTVGIIYQQFNLIPSINILDNVVLPRIFMGVPLKEREKRGRELLQRFGVAEIEKKTPGTLSGGQQQRVAVARSLVNDPEILLADEPVGNLDSVSAGQVMDKLDEINSKDKKTVILVTHDAKYLPYAHRVYYMKDGKVRRIVVNPEKKQVKTIKPGETIVTEIEQLARMYPYSDPLELKVKSIINFLTQGLNLVQLERLEKNILQILEGKMDQEIFFDILVRDMNRGGLGMLPDVSKKMSEKMFKLVEQSQDIRRFRDNIHEDNMFLQQQKFIDRLTEYISEECLLVMSKKQLAVIREAVADRLSGVVSHVDFEERMALPIDLGGAELKSRTARNISSYLEKLIAQGGYSLKPKE